MTDSGTDDLHLTIGQHHLRQIAQRIKEHYRREFQRDIPLSDIDRAVGRLLESHIDALTEDLFERVTTPGRPEWRELRSLLIPAVPGPAAAELQPAGTEADVFTGYREFSLPKFAAMTAYIASRGREVYKTKLNKLLFYSDFINFYLNGASISGARYVHAPFGPVPEGYESSIREMAEAGDVQLINAPGFVEIKAVGPGDGKGLDAAEKASIDWVLENIGWMSASEISTFSHEEKAYRFTRQGENIAYEYVKFFRKLPEK